MGVWDIYPATNVIAIQRSPLSTLLHEFLLVEHMTPWRTTESSCHVPGVDGKLVYLHYICSRIKTYMPEIGITCTQSCTVQRPLQYR